MRILVLSVTLAAAAAIAVAAANVPPNVSPGLWQFSSTVTSNGTPPMPTKFFQRLSPEKQAKLLASMRARSGAQSGTRTWQRCVTPEDISNWRLFKSDNMNCEQTIDKSTSTELDGHWTCNIRPGVVGSGVVHLQANLPQGSPGPAQSASGTVHMVYDMNGQQYTSDAVLSGTWINSDCSKIDKKLEEKPGDLMRPH